MCDNIKVAVRVRPLVESERQRGCARCVDTVTELNQISVNNERCFTFNYVFGDESTQEEVYETAVQRLVRKLFEGYNVTVLAYGQTGSGKTHTMGSSHQYADGDSGVIPRAVHDIFKHKDENQDWDYKIYVSFMELYKEQLYDLLAAERTTVDIREDTKGVCIPTLTEVPVNSPDTTMRCLLNGSQGRVTGATAMNSQSSRSHAIFTITIHQQKNGDPNTATQAKFHLVDLAGSERSKKTQAEGDRFKEGVTINSGLLALGNVIAALGEGGKQMPSYRNSKLTRLLQDSLGGNSMTLMIACISPADYNMLETVNTLRYADRAKRIKNKPIVNQDPKSAEIVALKQKVAQLQLQLASQGGVYEDPEVSAEKDRIIKELEQKLRKMRQSVTETLRENAEMRERIIMVESSRDRVKEKMDELQKLIPSFANFDQIPLPNEVKTHLDDLKKSFHEKFTNLVEEQKRCEEEQRRHESLNELENNDAFGNQDDTVDDLKQLDELQEKHTLKQCELNKEIRQVERELLLKVERCEHYAKTNTLVSDAYKRSLAVTAELEKQIAELEKQKTDLENAVRTLQAANKESDALVKQSELCKKNAEIEDFKKKLALQAKIVREKQTAEKKVEELKREILSMKQLKVKLIKQMKAEGDQFKAWRVSRDREAAQLREAARKHNNEMAKMQMMHSKQQNVCKRKLEQAVAANKRLKEALAKQNAVRAQRGTRGNKEQVQEFVAHEVEVLVSTVDARRSLQMLLEDREALTAEYAEMRKRTVDSKAMERLEAMEQEIELRNAQIADLQNKLADSDESKNKWEMVGSMADAKIALSHAVRLAADYRAEVLKRESAQLEAEQKILAEQEKLRKELMEKEAVLMTLKQQMEKERDAHHVEIISLETERQKTLNSFLESDKENNPMQEELKKKQREVSTLRNRLDTILTVTATPSAPLIRKKRVSVNFELEDLNLSSDGKLNDDDEVADPTWRQTPLGQRLARLRASTTTGRKRNNFGEPLLKCSCKSNCSSNRCMCYKIKRPCDDNCGCDAEKCGFKLNGSLRSLENSQLNHTFVKNDESLTKRQKTKF